MKRLVVRVFNSSALLWLGGWALSAVLTTAIHEQDWAAAVWCGFIGVLIFMFAAALRGAEDKALRRQAHFEGRDSELARLMNDVDAAEELLDQARHRKRTREETARHFAGGLRTRPVA